MRHTSYLAVALALALPCLARPDGTGAHHGGHHADHAAASAPSSGYAQPSDGYAQPSDAYAQPSDAYAQPNDAYAPPSTGYAQPNDAYASTGYESPTGYEQPGDAYAPTGYEEPAGGYGAPAQSVGGFDLSTLIIPILIIAGLALLFPSTTLVPVVPPPGRRRRAAGETEANLLERVQDIYMAVVESEECMERVACEVGGIAADAGLNKGMSKMAESFVPSKYQKMMKNFNSAKDCHKIKCGAF